MVLELARQLAHGGQREAERLGKLGDRPFALRADVGEQDDVAPAERWVAVDEGEQLAGRAPARPEPSHQALQGLAELRQLLLFGYHRVTIIEREERR